MFRDAVTGQTVTINTVPPLQPDPAGHPHGDRVQQAHVNSRQTEIYSEDSHTPKSLGAQARPLTVLLKNCTDPTNS